MAVQSSWVWLSASVPNVDGYAEGGFVSGMPSDPELFAELLPYFQDGFLNMLRGRWPNVELADIEWSAGTWFDVMP